MAYKLAQALGAPGAEDDIELVALATVADLMPLVGENRRLVREGLRALSRTSRPGLRALMTVSKADPSALDTGTLGFRLAPRINAAGRLRRADAGPRAAADRRRAARRRDRGRARPGQRRAARGRAADRVGGRGPGRRAGRRGRRAAYVLAGEGWHPGVVGIVASRIVERHHRPVVVVALDGRSRARARRGASPASTCSGALHACRRAPRALRRPPRGGGDDDPPGPDRRLPGRARAPCRGGPGAGAAGGARAGRRDRVRLRARPRARRGARAARAVRDGQPRSRLLVPGARLRDPRPMGDGRHLRFVVGSGGTSARAVAFGCGGQLGVEAEEPVDATFRLERNFWNGAVEPRLVLGHARPCAPDAIEVLGEPDDYLAAALGATADLDVAAGVAAQRRTRRTMLDRRGPGPAGGACATRSRPGARSSPSAPTRRAG